METAGLVIGSVSLATLFTTCVDCFEYIHLGRQFGRNYQTAVLKLDLLKLRLSRWADAVSKSGYGVANESEYEITKVKETLGQVIYLFEETEKRSAKFGKTSLKQDAPVPDNVDFEAIHLKMRSLALKRQKRSSFAKKASWALHEEKSFNRLIEDIGPLVRDLVEMFPAVKEQQQQLSVEDAQELRTEKAIGTLQEANEGPGEDELLREAVDQAIAAGDRVQHRVRENITEGGALARFGDHIEGEVPGTKGPGNVYERNKATGQGTIVHYGNYYGKESIFSSSRQGKVRPEGDQ